VPRPKSTLPGKVQTIQVQVGGFPIMGIHDLRTGRKNKIHPKLLEEPKILLFAAGVPRQVIGAVELEGVDENGRGHPSRGLPSNTHQGPVTFVQCPHGRGQASFLSLGRVQGGKGFTQFFNGSGNKHGL